MLLASVPVFGQTQQIYRLEQDGTLYFGTLTDHGKTLRTCGGKVVHVTAKPAKSTHHCSDLLATANFPPRPMPTGTPRPTPGPDGSTPTPEPVRTPWPGVILALGPLAVEHRDRNGKRLPISDGTAAALQDDVATFGSSDLNTLLEDIYQAGAVRTVVQTTVGPAGFLCEAGPDVVLAVTDERATFFDSPHGSTAILSAEVRSYRCYRGEAPKPVQHLEEGARIAGAAWSESAMRAASRAMQAKLREEFVAEQGPARHRF